MDILSEISVAQWVIVGIGVLIAFPAVFPWLQGLLSGVNMPKPKPVPQPKPTPVHEGHELTDLVCKWECLADSCHDAGLHEACKVLDTVFPLLIGSRESEHEGGDEA